MSPFASPRNTFSNGGSDIRELTETERPVEKKGRARIRQYIFQSADAAFVTECIERINAACHLFEVSFVLVPLVVWKCCKAHVDFLR